jgi:HEAT repeat protein
MYNSKGAFSYIEKSELPALYGEQAAVDQQIRLELLNTLAVLGDSHVEEMIRSFLTSRHWGVPSMAAGSLLLEGSEAAADAVYALLVGADKKVALQAAVTLAIWGRDPRALTALQEGYIGASSEQKERILEALGYIGDKSLIPFLIKRIQEPFGQRRLVAASSLLQCLRS